MHQHAFAGQGRAWSAKEFAGLLQSDLVFAVGDSRAFALGRVIAGEAELLTLATHPEHRRLGLARDRLSEYEAAARGRDAVLSFLEVAADNPAALALYLKAGYRENTRRAGYYQRPGGQRVDALMMHKELS